MMPRSFSDSQKTDGARQAFMLLPDRSASRRRQKKEDVWRERSGTALRRRLPMLKEPRAAKWTIACCETGFSGSPSSG
jgi:hypothetical protein